MTAIDRLKIAFIGAGTMGGALITALARNISPDHIFVYEIDPEKRDSLPAGVVRCGNEAAAADADIIVVAVKPDAVAGVLSKISGVGKGAIVSVAAGVTIAAMERVLGDERPVVRAMPNTPVRCGAGMTVLSFNQYVNDELAAAVKELFSLSGLALVLPEKLMDAVTGLSGSGPAFVFTFIQALADAGVKSGIPRKEAQILASQTVLGSAKMVMEGMGDPITLRGRVTSPGGTTIEGVHVLERAGFAGIVMDAVTAAVQKSKKLGEG